MTDLLPHPATDGILLPAGFASTATGVELVREAMTAYLETTRAILDPGDWQGPQDQAGSFVKKSGWQKVAKAYRLSTEIVSTEVDRHPDTDRIIRAGATVRAIAPNGQYREATGYCEVDEPRFDRAQGRQKLENDLRNTAATRAENRAISNLCGLGAVSAEEMGDTPPAAVEVVVPAWASSIAIASTAARLQRLLDAMGADPARYAPIGNELFVRCENSIPACCGYLLDLLLDSIAEPLPEVQS